MADTVAMKSTWPGKSATAAATIRSGVQPATRTAAMSRRSPIVGWLRQDQPITGGWSWNPGLEIVAVPLDMSIPGGGIQAATSRVT